MPTDPMLYQINTRVHLNRLSAELGRPATLDDLPGAMLDGLAAQGFDWLYLLGVWQTGPLSRQVALAHAGLQADYHRLLPDFSEADACGSCFAISGYQVSAALGGEAALQRLRARLQRRGLNLMLDFIPNHVGLDHPWVEMHPEYLMAGSSAQYRRAPQNYIRIAKDGGEPLLLAHGRDPYFDGWSDTLQLNYASPALVEAMTGELLRAGELCDGLRSDMAMLILPEVFERTWGVPAVPFWEEAISRLRAKAPGFLMMAEVYWDMEGELQRLGFDYCYDKRLYDALVGGSALEVRALLERNIPAQNGLARFLENHDEKRAATALRLERHRAAAVLCYTLPGLRFFHEGQLDGWRVKIPMQLCRGPAQPVDVGLQMFYRELLVLLQTEARRAGNWLLLAAQPAWENNPTHRQFVAYVWETAARGTAQAQRLVCVTNFAENRGQCYLPLPWDDLAGRAWRLLDTLSDVVYDRSGDDLAARGLYLDLPGYGFHSFWLDVIP